MTARTRKLIGTIVFLLGLAIYATLAAMIGSGRIALAPGMGAIRLLRHRGSCLGDPGGTAHPLDAKTGLAYAALTWRKRFHRANGAPDR